MKLPRIHLAYGTHLNPTRDWGVLATLGLVLIAVSLTWNLILFNRVANGRGIGSPVAHTKTILDQRKLDALAQIFADREVEATKYKNGTYRFIDPSQ